MRLALITESTTRHTEAMEAYRFYQSHRSRWVNSIISFMNVRNFPTEDIFFVSRHHKRLIGFNEIIDNYPVYDYHPKKKECMDLANIILNQIQSLEGVTFVEIHAGSSLAVPIKQLLEASQIPCRIFAEGEPLAAKPLYYERLIEEEQNIRKLRDIQRERWSITSLIQQKTLKEASEILSKFGTRAQLYGIEESTQKLKELLGDWNQGRKEERRAKAEFEEILSETDHTGELEDFIKRSDSLSALCSDVSEYERLKTKFGRTIAVFTKYLTKHEYVLQIENRVSAALLKMQIALLK